MPPNYFDKDPIRLTTAEKPATDGAKGNSNMSMRTSQYQGSMAESVYSVDEDSHEVVWEQEGNPSKPPTVSEGPTIDFQSLTRTT